MTTRHVVLDDQQHDFVEALVRTGRYRDINEVLREGLRLVEERELLMTARLDALQEAADQGWADIAAGRYRDIADDELGGFIAQLGEQAAARTPTRE